MKDDKSIIIKGANKSAAVTIWDCEDYIKEASKQLKDKDVYLEVPNDSSALLNTIFESLRKVRKRGDLSHLTLSYFLVKDPKFARFYLLPEIHKWLYDAPGRPVISNWGFLHRKCFFIFRLSFTASCPEDKIIYKRHK